MAGRTFRRAGHATEEVGSVIGVDSAEDRDDTRDDTIITVAEDSDTGSGDNISERFETVTGEPIEPANLRGEETSGEVIGRRQRRQRSDAGQKRGTRNNQKQKKFQETSLEKLLLSLHLMGATFFHTPELQIDAQESEMLSKAILDVFAAYGVPELTEKQLAAIQAIGVGVAVYGTRGVAYVRRKTQPKIAQPVSIPQQPAPTVPQQNQAQQPPKPNGSAVKYAQGFVQSPVSPFGDADGMDL